AGPGRRWPLVAADTHRARPGVAELAADTAWCFPLGEPGHATGVLVIGDSGQDRLPRDVAALAADLACRIGLALDRAGQGAASPSEAGAGRGPPERGGGGGGGGRGAPPPGRPQNTGGPSPPPPRPAAPLRPRRAGARALRGGWGGCAFAFPRVGPPAGPGGLGGSFGPFARPGGGGPRAPPPLGRRSFGTRLGGLPLGRRSFGRRLPYRRLP